jgi:RNA-directed DNA polymerase
VPLEANSPTERPTSSERLMESICDPQNLNQAMAKVIANGGSPGIDGLSVGKLEQYFQRHRERIIGELLGGTYRPQPVKQVEIPNPLAECESLAFPRWWIA